MNRLLTRFLGLFVVLSLCYVVPAYADANEVVALQSEVQDLNGKVASLERIVKDLQKGAQSKAAYIPSGGGGGILTSQGITMGGHIDVQHNFNFDDPFVSGATGAESTGRIFDSQSDSFVLNAAELYFENAAENTGDAGFRIDLDFGNDSTVVLADGLGGDEIDVQQAYVEYIAGLPFFEGSEIFPNSIHIKAGRFATLAGFEVIEGPDNWNITRSLAFGTTIPFTHTGVRTNFGMFNDYLDVYVGLNNGWDLPLDNNTYKTLELGVGWSPLEDVDLFHTFYWGPEKSGTNNARRILFTNTVTWSATDKLTLAGEANVGHEDDIPDAARVAGAPAVPRSNEHNGNWWSFNTYANYQFTDKFSTTARYEILRDSAVDRTPLFGLTSDTVFAQTYTAEYKITDNLISRLEFRHDKSNDDTEFGDDSSRSSLHTQMIYLI